MSLSELGEYSLAFISVLSVEGEARSRSSQEAMAMAASGLETLPNLAELIPFAGAGKF